MRILQSQLQNFTSIYRLRIYCKTISLNLSLNIYPASNCQKSSQLMSSGYYLTSSFYYFNLGAHMMYILRNRLEAQNVKKQKIIKILQDISNAIFKEHFIQSLVIPQDPFNIVALKDVFSRLAHSSIMKLDQSSMEKMYYLMLMSVKKEIYLLSSPFELYSLTLSHLLNITKSLEESDAVGNIQFAISQFQKVASRYTFIQFMEIREYMLSELQKHQTKIVNFIQAGLQTDVGKMIFRIRNSHNQKSLGSGTNQSDQQMVTAAGKHIKQLFYNDWASWRTSLVIDFVQDYKKASESRKNMKNRPGNELKQQNQKSLGDILNLNKSNLQNFEVKFDLFQDEIDLGQLKGYEYENSQSNVKKTGNSSANTRTLNSFKNKIQQQFSDLKLDKKDQEEEPDLLGMMDT